MRDNLIWIMAICGPVYSGDGEKEGEKGPIWRQLELGYRPVVAMKMEDERKRT